MPRDFVPCLYHEREMYDEVSQHWHKRYEVTEGFGMADRETGEPYITLSRDSHAYHRGVTFSACAHADYAPEDFAMLDTSERESLFTTFYAAMAALE